MPVRPDDETPAVRPASVSKIKTLYETCLTELARFTGVKAEGAVLTALAREVRLHVVPKAAPDVVNQTCLNVAGKVVTPELSAELARRVAGNADRLQGLKGYKARPVNVWSGQADREWVIGEVTAVRSKSVTYKATAADARSKGGLVNRTGHVLTFRILNGLPAGMVVDKFFSGDAVDVVKTDFGFSRFNREKFSTTVSSRRDYPFVDTRELFGMYTLLLVDPKKCTAETVSFSHTKAGPALVAKNRALMQMRTRESFECPKRYTLDQVECHSCWVGTDQCPAACHRVSYVRRQCPGCLKDLAADPSDGSGLCIGCAAKE